MTSYTNLGISSIIEFKFKNLEILRNVFEALKTHSELQLYTDSVDGTIASIEDHDITIEILSGLLNLKSDDEIEEYVEKCWKEYKVPLGYEIIIMYNVICMDGNPYIRHQIFGEAGLPTIDDLCSNLKKAKALFLELSIPEEQINLGYRMSQC